MVGFLRVHAEEEVKLCFDESMWPRYLGRSLQKPSAG